MLLASCGTEIKFHKWPCGDYFGSYQIPEAGFYIPCISWCNEGELLITTVPSLGPPIVISVCESSMQMYHVIDLPANHIQAATFSRNIQKNIALGTDNGCVMIYDLGRKSVTRQLPNLPCGVKYLQYGAKDTSLAAACKNGQIILYNSKNNVCATFYVPNTNNLTAMACHDRYPNILGAASGEGTVVVWDSTTGNIKFFNKSHCNSITDLSFCYDNTMASVGLDERFIGYDLRTKDCIFCCKSDEQLSAVEFMPSSDMIAVATIDGKLFSYDKRQINHPLHTIVAHHPKSIGRIAFQNINTTIEESPCDPCDIQQHETKSQVTTVVYNGSGGNADSIGVSSRHPSTINSILADSDCDWQLQTSELTAYLESLQQNNLTVLNRGDAGDKMITVEIIPELKSHGSAIPSPQKCPSNTDIFLNINSKQGSTSPLLSKFSVPPSTTPLRSSLNRGLIEDIPNNLDSDRSDVISNWIRKLPLNPPDHTGNSIVATDHDEDIVKLRKELQDVTKDTIEQLAEMINSEFLKVRMAVSRGFVQMEYKMNARWREFNTALMKLAGQDPQKDESKRNNEYVKDDEELHETVVRKPSSSRSLLNRTRRS